MDGLCFVGHDLEGGGAVEDDLCGDDQVDDDGDGLVIPAEESLHIVSH